MNATEPTPEPVRCPECTAYNGKHCFDCSLQTVEEKIAWGPYYHDAWLDQQRRDSDYGTRLRALVTLWQGKHALLRHENNKLRKKVKAAFRASGDCSTPARDG